MASSSSSSSALESGDVKPGGSGAFYGSQGEQWITHPAVQTTVQEQMDMKGKVNQMIKTSPSTLALTG
jgi:hypothetical protein